MFLFFFCSDSFYSYFQVKSKIENAKPTPRIAPTKTWRKNAIENKENNIGKNTKSTNAINTKRQYEKKNDRTTDYDLTAEEEELFDGIDEDELIELAGELNKLLFECLFISVARKEKVAGCVPIFCSRFLFLFLFLSHLLEMYNWLAVVCTY